MIVFLLVDNLVFIPSMKVPPKRKGNRRLRRELGLTAQTLNESPSEKEGKCPAVAASATAFV